MPPPRYAADTEVSVDKSKSWTAIPVAERAFAAGLFEGEGTITISPSVHHKANGELIRYTRPIVTLTNTERTLIDFLQARWPGTIRSYQPKGNAKRAHSWTLNAGQYRILDFFDAIEPFVVSGRMKARIALLRIDILLRTGKGKARSAKYRTDCYNRLGQMQKLNQRGISVGEPSDV